MRVLILSQYYKPEPVPKPAELAEALRERGHTVSVLTGFPNYPSGELYPGFRLSLLHQETVDGIPVTRTFEFPYHGKRVLGRLLNYASFMVSAFLGGFFVPPCDVIYVWHPPLSIGVAAWLVSRLRGVPFIYDVQDIWPESAVLSGLLKDGWMTRLMSRMERFVYRQAHHILVVTEGARANLLTKGVPAGKVSVMPHWIEENLFVQTDESSRDYLRKQYGWHSRFVMVFAGNLGLVQGLETVVQAAAILPADSPVLIVLIGDGTDKEHLQHIVDALGLGQRVQFIERQPMEKMPMFMSGADALMVHLKRSDLSKYVIPTKTLAYLAAGQPILMAMEGAAAHLVHQAGAGILAPPEDPAEMAKAIRLLSEMSLSDRAAMGQRGQAYLRRHLSKANVITQYEAILQDHAKQTVS